MQSKNTKTQGLLTEMSSKKIKAPQVERISSLDSGRPPVMIFTSRGKVATKSLNGRVFEALDESSLRGEFESGNLNKTFYNENIGNNRHVNGKITANGVNSGSYLGSTETQTKRRPAPAVPVTKQTAPGGGNSLVSSRGLSLSSSLQSLNNKLPLESDNKVRPPLIPPPKSFLQRQSPLSSSTSSLSSLHLSPTSQLPQSPMTQRKYTSDLSLPPPPPDANNNEETFQASVSTGEYQQNSHLATTKTTRAPQPPALPSPPPPPSPPSHTPPHSPPTHTPPHSPLPSQSSTHSSSSASSSPLNRFRFPPPPTTPPSPMEINETHTPFTNTSVSSALPTQAHSDRERKSTLSANEVMDYFDEAIGGQLVSASSYNDTSSHPAFSPVFHFPSVSDDKQLEQMSPAIEPSTQISRDVGNKVESNETATNISTTSYSKNRSDEDSYVIHQTEFSYSENKASEENSTQNLSDNSMRSPKSEEERTRKGNASSKSFAVSKLRPETKTVRQYIKPGIVDELANLFSNITDEQITSPSSKNEFDFNIRETLEKLESVDKRGESMSPVMRNAKRSSILSPSELFPRLQSSVSAESLHGRPRSLHTPAYSKVNQWPRLYQVSSTNTLYTPPASDETTSTPGFDFLAASREIHKHVVLIRSNSRAGVTANNKVDEVKHDSSVSNTVDNAPIIRSKSPDNQFTEEKVETFNIAHENLITAAASSATESNRTDTSHIDLPLTTSEMLTGESHSFATATEIQDTCEFPHPTITPTNSRSSSRRSSLEDNSKSQTEHLSISVPLNEAASSRGRSRSNSPRRGTSSQSSSRRSSLEDKRKQEDTSNYSNGVDLEGTLTSVVTRRSTGSPNSSRSNSPDRKSDVVGADVLSTAVIQALSRSSSRSNSMKGEHNKPITLHKLHSKSGSSASTSPANSRNSSRAGSVRRSENVNENYKSLAEENDLASKFTTSFSQNNDTHIETADSDRKASLDDHSNALDGLSSYSEAIKSEHRIVDAHTENSDNHWNTTVHTTTSAHSSRSSSRSGSMKIRDNKDEVNLELPHSTVDTVLVGAMRHTGSSGSSRSSSPEKSSTENAQTTVYTVDKLFSKRDSISSNSSRKSHAERETINSGKLISGDYENVGLLETTSLASSNKSLPDSLHNRNHEGEVSLELPNSLVGIQAVKSGAVYAPSHTSSKNSSRSHSPDRDIGSKYILQSSNSPVMNRTSITSSPERSRRSSQADEVSQYYDQTTKEHHKQVTSGSTSSRSSSRSGSFKIRDNDNEVYLDFPSPTVETVGIDTTSVHAAKATHSRNSSGSSSPHREINSEDTIQSFDKEFVKRRSSISSSPDSSRKSSLVGLTAGVEESQTNIDTNLTPLHETRTDWTSFLQQNTKSQEESAAVFSTALENKHTSTHTSPSSSKSSSREGSPERNKTNVSKQFDLKGISMTPPSSRSSSLAGSVRNKTSGHESDTYKSALDNSLGFTVNSTASATSSESRSSSVNRDDSQQMYINDEKEASDKHAIPSTSFYSRNDDEKDQLDYKLLMDKYAIESVTSTSSNWWDSHTKKETSDITQKESHGMDLKNTISSSKSSSGSERSSRKSSPERNQTAVEHSFHQSQIVENIESTTFTAAESPAHSRRSSNANPVADIHERNEQNEAHTFFKRAVGSSNSPASSRRSSSSLAGESTKANQQLHDDTIYANIGTLEDTNTVKEIKSQSQEEIPHFSVSILNSANNSTRMSPVSSRRSSQIYDLHNGGLENQKDETVSLASKSSSSSATTTPAGSRKASHDGKSVKDTGLYTVNSTSDLATTGNTDSESVIDMYVRTRSRDSSPGGSVERKETWNDKETDSYQLALQSALESTRITSTTADSRQDRQGSLIKRDSTSNNSKSSSRSGSPTQNRSSDLQADHFNVTLEKTLASPTVSNDVTYTSLTSDITSGKFTKSEKGEQGAYSLPSTENLNKVTTFEDKNYTLKYDAAVNDFNDTAATLGTYSETHVNTTEGKHSNTYYTEVGSKLIGDPELKDTYNFETRLPTTDGELLTSNLGSNVNFPEKDSMASVDSVFHLAEFSSNNVDHSEVSQSMNIERADRSSFSVSADMYSQPRVTDYRDQVTSITYEKNTDDSSDDDKTLLYIDDKPLLYIDDKPSVEYVETVVDIHVHDKEDTLSQLSTASQFGSDKDVVDIPDNGSVSSDSDQSSSHKIRHDEYTVNETPDEDSSVYINKTDAYSFNDFKEGIAHTSSNPLSSFHDKHESNVQEVAPRSYVTDSAVLPDFSEKDTTKSSRKSSISSASDIGSSDGKGRPVLETSFKNEDEHAIFQKIGGNTNVLTRQERVINQLSEDVHEETGESFSFLMTDHSNDVLHKEIGSGVIDEKENADFTESKNTKDTEQLSTNSVVMQLLADAPIVIDSETPGLHEGAHAIPVTEHSTTDQSKDFLAVLDDINIDTDITSGFLRRSSRFSGTTSPAKRQSQEGKSVPDDNSTQINAEGIHDPMTKTILSRTAFILKDFQAKETAYTTETGNQELATGLVNDIDVNHSDSLRALLNDEMHKACHDIVQRKDVDTDVNINYDTNRDNMMRRNSVEELMHSSVRNTNERNIDMFGLSAGTEAAASRDYDIGLESHNVHDMKTEMTEAGHFVADVDIEMKSESIHVNENLSSLVGEVVVNTNHKEGEPFALREENGLLNEYVKNIVYQAAASKTDTGQIDVDVREDKQQVDSYVHDVIRHSVDTINTEDMDKSYYVNELDDNVREDKQQVDSYVHDVIRHSVDTINTEDMDKSYYVNELDDDVREDKDQVDSYVHDVIRHSVDTINTEGMNKSYYVNELDDDVREDKDQVDSYVHDVIRHSVDTIHTEGVDKSKYVNELEVDVKMDKDRVHSYVYDIIQQSVDTIHTEGVDRETSNDEKRQSYPEHDFGQNTDYESFEQMEVAKSSRDVHLDFNEGRVSEEFGMHDVAATVAGYRVSAFSREDSKQEDHVDVHEEKPSIDAYVGNIIQYSVDTFNTEKVESKVNTYTDHHDLSIDDHSSHLDIGINNEFQEPQLRDTPLLPSNLFNYEIEVNENDNNKEDSTLAYDKINSKELYLTNTATRGGLHISDDELQVKATDNEEINPHFIADLQSTDVQDAFNESREKIHAGAVDVDFGIPEKYLGGESRESFMNDVFHHLDHRDTEAISSENNEIKKQPEFDESAFDFLHKSHAKEHPPTSLQYEDGTASKYSFGRWEELTRQHIKEVTGDQIESSGSAFKIEASGGEDIHTEIMTQSEKAYVHAVPPDHFLDENTEENQIESDEAFHEIKQKENIYVTNSTAAPFEFQKSDHSEREIEDIHTEIMTQSEKAYVHAVPAEFDIHPFRAENIEENKIESDEAFHNHNKKESIYVNNSTATPFEVHKIGHFETEVEDIHTEIMTQSEKAYVHAEPPDHFLEENIEENKIEYDEGFHDHNKKESIHVNNLSTTPFEVHKIGYSETEVEDIHTEIMTQSEKAYVHAEPPDHFLEENIEENKIESDEDFRDHIKKESIYVTNSTAAPSEVHKRDHSEIDLEDEIRKQHLILSPKLTDESEYDKALNLNLDTSRSSRGSVSSVHSYQIQDHLHTTRETTFNSEFFVRDHSSSDDRKQDLSRLNSVGVTAESSLFLPQNNDNISLSELQHKEHSDTVDEFNRILDNNSKRSTSSRSSVSSIDSERNNHHTLVTSNSSGLGETVHTETHALPSTESLLVADKSSRSNIKVEYERLNLEEQSTDFGSAKARPYIDVVEDSFGFEAQPESNAREIGTDLNQPAVSVAQLAQTLRSTSNDEESTKQKEDESHLFSRDKFQALRNVFEKQQETMPESSSFKIKQNSYKPGLDPNSVSESKHTGNWELNRQVSSGSSITSNDKKEIRGHLTSATQIEEYTSVDSDSDRVMAKWDESGNDTNPDVQNQVHKKTVLTKKLSYDLQSRELRRGSTSSASSASSVDSKRHAEMDIRPSDNQGEAYSSNFQSDDHYPKNSLFSQKPGLMNLAQWSTQPTYVNENESVYTKRKSSVSSNNSSASQNEGARLTSGEFDGSTYKETSHELHSLRETDRNQIHDIAGEVSNPLFDDSSSTVEEDVGFRNRTNSASSLSSNKSSSLEIEDHSLFSQENVGRFPPIHDQVASMQSSFVTETAKVNSDQSSVKSHSTKISSLGDVDNSLSSSDKNFSFRENNLMKTNTTEFLAGNVKAQVGQQLVSESLDRGAAVRRHSSSGSEKEAKLIGAFLRSGAAHDISSSHISRQSSEIGSEKMHQSTQPGRLSDVIDSVHGKRRVSSSSDSSDSGKKDLSKRATRIHSDTPFTESQNTVRNYEDLTSTDHNTQNHKFQSEEAFTVVSHNFSQPSFRRDSLTNQEVGNQSHIYKTPEDKRDFRSLQENSRSPINVDERPTVKTYVIKRSITSDVFEKPDEHLGETVVINRGLDSTENSPDVYTNRSTVPETTAREVTDIYSQTQESVKPRHLQSSPFNMDSFDQGIKSNKENFSLEMDRSYRDRVDSHLPHDNGGTRHEIKRPGLDNSPIFPSLFNRDTSVLQTYRYTGVRYGKEKPTSPGVNSATIHRNQHTPVDDRFQFTPITISTVSQAVVGDTVGVNIDFSPHSPNDISFPSDEDSNQQRFIVKNVQQTSVLKNSHNSSSDIIFAKEEAATEDVNQIINRSGTLSPRTVVDGPIFSSNKSQRSHLSRSFSSDNSLASPREYNNDSGPKGYDINLTSNDNNYQSGNLYRVLSVSPNGGPEFTNTEAERGRSRNRNNDFTDTINNSRTPRKQHHSPERFFKNPKLSLRQEDYDNKGYSSDDEDGKHYHHVTKVYLSGESPRSRSQSPNTSYRVSSLKTQNSLPITQGNSVQDNDWRNGMSEVRSLNNLGNRSPDSSDYDSHSSFQEHQQRYKVVGTLDSSLDKHLVRAQSSPKLDRKHVNYYPETTITRTQAAPPQLSNAPAAKHTHKSVVQLEVGSNYITGKSDPDDDLNSRYMIKRVRSADDLRDSTLAVGEEDQNSSDRKMWKTSRSKSTERYLTHGDSADGAFERTGKYDLPRTFMTTANTHVDKDKMYVVNSTSSNTKDNHEHDSTPHGWYTSTVDFNDTSPKRTQNWNPSYHEEINSHNYKTEKTVYISNKASPQPNVGNVHERTKEFAFRDYGEGPEIANSLPGNEHPPNAHFERINDDTSDPHNLDYSRSTEDLSNDLRVLRGKILIKNRFDNSEFSEDDIDQNANLFDTSFHLGKDNPVYSSDPDIAASLRREEERDLSKFVTQDVTFETVDRLAHQYKGDKQVQLSPGPQRKKPNLSSLLLSKLALVDSKDIRQTVDVEHHNEEIHGDIRFVHADGEQKESKDTYNFDSVNEKVELTLTQGKANVLIKVIAERVIPTNTEFSTWRKSQAIVTRHIEIDLQANEQMKRLYKRVMTKSGKSGSLEGSSRLSSYNSASLSSQERDLNSMETLQLFTQILDVAEQQSSRDNPDSGVRHELGQLPASVMDMLY